MATQNSSVEARAAIEGLRAGAVNRSVVEWMTYGRDAEMEELRGHIVKNTGGSSQILVGGYGVGKSHLCEALAWKLESEGYAVARLELGASHGRAESPRSVVSAIERSLTVRIEGRRYSGARGLGILECARRCLLKSRPLVAASEKLGVPENLSKFRRIYRSELDRCLLECSTEAPSYSPGAAVPRPMTSVNVAVSSLNKLAHSLGLLTVPGLVIIFDEAERSEFGANWYHESRAKDLMLGFALAAANRDTSRLKHYRNDTSRPYLTFRPSKLHTIFAFTRYWGLARLLANRIGQPTIDLEPLGDGGRTAVEERVTELYAAGYGAVPRLNARDRRLIEEFSSGEDIRSFIRSLVAALDENRLRNGRHGRV